MVEVLIAVVLIGAIASAYFATATTQTRASSSNRELVQADAVARGYAELAKADARTCTAGSNVTVDTSTFSGYSTSPSGFTCPASGDPPVTINLTVTSPPPDNSAAHMSFEVLAP